MNFDVLTLFPDLFTNFIQESLIQKAIENGRLHIRTINIRDFSQDKHQKVDDTPYGGGSGMLLKPEPIFSAFDAILKDGDTHSIKTIYLTPTGTRLDHSKVLELATFDRLILLCGRYEGVDQRVIDELVDEEISIGDYVLFGGEIPAMVLMEAVSRHVKGVLGNEESLSSESFASNLLEYPQYTKPREFRGLSVPEVLFSGNHKAIEEWKKEQSILKTRARRPELLDKKDKL